MSIDRQTVVHMGRLARLRLSEDDVERYGATLNDILAYVDKLAELDTTGVEPTTHAVPLVIEPRSDDVERRLNRDDVLKNAPQAEDGHFRVPKVVEG